MEIRNGMQTLQLQLKNMQQNNEELLKKFRELENKLTQDRGEQENSRILQSKTWLKR